jgi:PII-like signaling protein
MRTPGDAVLLRAFVSEADKSGALPLYEAIVLKARELHLNGVTVLRGSMGFRCPNQLHAARSFAFEWDLPVVVEIVDSQEKIDQFLPELKQLMSGGLVTMEKVKSLRYGS